MHNYEHKKLIETITQIDKVPEDSQAFSDWIHAEAHLEFLKINAQADNLVIYTSGEHIFINSVVVQNSKLTPVDQDDLLHWNMNAYMPIASYVSEGDRVWVERGLSGTHTHTLENSIQLVFGRTFEGWSQSGQNYFELNQEYTHLTDIHWRPEKQAYCRFNELGDIDPVVSVTTREDKGSNLSLVSFKWEAMEEYLASSDASLVRMFDFTLFRQLGFCGWPNEQPQKFYDSDNLFYRQMVVPSHAAYTRGVQIIRPRRSQRTIHTHMRDGWFGRRNSEYVEFIAHDWRNNRTTKISTAPNATTNYFNAEGNSLPFELSPAFFRPEVLLKYKTDKDKYTVGDQSVSCRAAWHLERFDVNEAGQIHAYICDLRRLPYQEQLHWLSFNEPPKTGISKRAITHDFQGEWITFTDPLQNVFTVIRRWHDEKVAWWTIRDEKLFDQVNTPLSESRDEWAEAFMDLAKLVVEGFETKAIRKKLDAAHIQYNKTDGTIILLEKILNKDALPDANKKLSGLRTVQLLRSKAKGHAGGSEAEKLAQEALMEYETFGNHFQSICTQVANELEIIEQGIS